ncbi:MAG: urea ABC transporter ATP-binding subunit UrtE [Candidatus Binatia bacterium]
MLEIHGLNQYYGESHILWDVAISIPAGVTLCLMGRNGVGKTTLLKTVMGLIPARNGHISFAGQELRGRPPELRARVGIGYVPQGREIFPQLTVEENLRIGLSARTDKLRTIPPKIFEWFPVLGQMLKRRGGDLSGGQQQQLAIGRALVTNPQLLILDEPTEGIQPNIVQEIGDIVQRLKREENMTVLLVEQKLPFARRLADTFAVMEKGAIVASGDISDLSDEVVRRHLSV